MPRAYHALQDRALLRLVDRTPEAAPCFTMTENELVLLCRLAAGSDCEDQREDALRLMARPEISTALCASRADLAKRLRWARGGVGLKPPGLRAMRERDLRHLRGLASLADDIPLADRRRMGLEPLVRDARAQLGGGAAR